MREPGAPVKIFNRGRLILGQIGTPTFIILLFIYRVSTTHLTIYTQRIAAAAAAVDVCSRDRCDFECVHIGF